MNDYLIALFLGLIEGLTEFIPVSSTGHLLLLGKALDFQSGASGHVFEVFIQIGAIFAVVVVYRARIWSTLIGLPKEKTAQKFTLNIILGTIPALVAGALLHDFVKERLYDPSIIGFALIIGGIIILALEKRLTRSKFETIDDITPVTAILIGCFQTIALIPGVSRSGATIMGALSCGVARPAAAEFSFFLAIPVMFAAVAYDTYKNKDAIMANDQMGIMLCGMLMAFVTAMIVIKFALHIIGKYGFAPFAVYRIILGCIVLGILWL